MTSISYYQDFSNFNQEIEFCLPCIFPNVPLAFDSEEPLQFNSVTNWLRNAACFGSYLHTTQNYWLSWLTKVTYHRGLQRNTRETQSYSRFLWWDNFFWIGIRFHLILSIAEIFFPLHRSPLNCHTDKSAFSDVPKCLHYRGFR